MLSYGKSSRPRGYFLNEPPRGTNGLGRRHVSDVPALGRATRKEARRLSPLSGDADSTARGNMALTAVTNTRSVGASRADFSSPLQGQGQLVEIGPSPPVTAIREMESQPVSLWPAKPLTTKQKQRVAKNSKAPLALQLEAFIRKEHRQYLLENPDCSRTDTLHIFREAFTVLVDHFTEYKSVLNLIRDEYDAALNEMLEQTKRMRVADLENKSDRSLHAMELIQLKESLNATISNQQAQLKASQGLLHALREQLAAAEHANSLLRYEMERRLKEHEDAKGQVKLLAQSMIEESGRTARIVEDSRRKEREMELMNARLKVMKENVEELEACLRAQTERRSRQESDSINALFSSRHRGTRGSWPRRTSDPPAAEGEDALGSPPGGATDGDGIPAVQGSYTDEYVHKLLSRIDELHAAAAVPTHKASRTPEPSPSPAPIAPVLSGPSEERDASTGGPASLASAQHHARAPGRPAEEELPVLREWLRHEGITEDDVEDTDYIIPTGNWPAEELSLLKACLPVANRHVTLADALRMLDELWAARERAMDYSRLPDFFLNWLTSRTGGGAGLRELGVNLLHACQRNRHHPECAAVLAVLRGYLPEQMVLTWRRQIQAMRSDFANDAAARGTGNEVPVEDLFERIRAAWPGKPRSHMLQLRAYVFRVCKRREDGALDVVDASTLLAPDSHFVLLLKQQVMREVEEFTLRVVEGVRAVADVAKNSVSLGKILRVVRELDEGIRNEALYNLVTHATQKTMVEVSSADNGALIPVRLDTLLTRFRGTVLLHRVGPEEL